MPTGIRITRKIDGTREFTSYEQKNSGKEDERRTILTSPVAKLTVNNHQIDSMHQVDFQTTDDLIKVVGTLGLPSTTFINPDASICHLCPDGKRGPIKHIHVFMNELLIVNPYYEQKIPNLKSVHCVSCNKKLAYTCSGTCSVGMIELYCSDECQKSNWSNHKFKCGSKTDANTIVDNVDDSVSKLSLRNLSIHDRSSNSNIGTQRRLPTSQDTTICSPKIVAEQLNSSIVVRHDSIAKPKQVIETITSRSSVCPSSPDTNLGSIRQPNSATRKVPRHIDPLADLPTGLLQLKRLYNTCVLSPDDSDRLIVYIPYDNEKLQYMMDIIGEKTTEIETSPISRHVDIGTTHVALSCDDSNWYRAIVTSVSNDGNCQVYYVDFGSSETLPRENLRDLTGRGLSLSDSPANAVKCKFSQNSPPDLIEQAMEGEKAFDMFVESFDEVNKLYILTLVPQESNKT